MRLLIFVTGHQPGTTVFSVPGCPPEMRPEEEEKGDVDAPALAFGNSDSGNYTDYTTDAETMLAL